MSAAMNITMMMMMMTTTTTATEKGLRPVAPGHESL